MIVMHFVFKSFIKDFADFKQKIKDAEFKTVEAEGFEYHNISHRSDNADFQKMLPDIDIKHSFTRAYMKDIVNPTFIHSDLDYADYIGVLFIQKNANETDEEAGLKVWRHKATNAMSLEYSDPCFSHKAKLTFEDSKDVSKWDEMLSFPFQENTMVVFPAKWFHSKAIPENKGTSIDDCRIVHVLFFNEVKK